MDVTQSMSDDPFGSSDELLNVDELDKKKNKLALILLIAVGLLFLIAVGVFYFFFYDQNSKKKRKNIIRAKYRTKYLNENVKLFSEKNTHLLNKTKSIRVNNETTINGNYFILNY